MEKETNLSLCNHKINNFPLETLNVSLLTCNLSISTMFHSKSLSMLKVVVSNHQHIFLSKFTNGITLASRISRPREHLLASLTFQSSTNLPYASQVRFFSDTSNNSSATGNNDSNNSTSNSETSEKEGTNTTTEANDATNNASNVKSPEQELISKLQLEVKDLKDQVLRSYAEEENVRRIAKRDVANAKDYANTSFAKSIVDIADDLDRALALDINNTSIPPEKHLHTLLEGIKLTQKNLEGVFRKFHIQKYGIIGDEFDPKLHDALFQIPDTSKPANTIGQVLKSGYKLNDRVIRAAEVGAVVHP